MPHQDIERSLFELGHTIERLIEGVHIFWLKGCSEDGSRRVPATVGQLAGQAVDDLRDLIAHGLDENVRELAYSSSRRGTLTKGIGGDPITSTS